LPSWCWGYIPRFHKYDWVWVTYCSPYGYTPREDEKPPKAEERKTGSNEGAAAAATLVVELPSEAKLTIDGQATASTSTTRTFVTPELQAGQDYVYTLEARFEAKGEQQTVTRVVTVRAGETTRVALMKPEVTVAR
jgi:uncharacterized protein (TIGR03000 family)